MNGIESKEIRGLSLKNLIAIISATVLIVATVLVRSNAIEAKINENKAYFELKITEIRNDQITSGKISEMNFKIYDAFLKDLQSQLDKNRRDIEILRNK